MKRPKQALAALVTAAAIVTVVLVVPTASAAATATSDNGIAFIKSFEGFSSHVYWDSGYAFIGYGTMCRSTDYPNGITEAKAEALMREALKPKEAEVNDFLTKYGILLTQNQYDAILSLTYNLGDLWMDPDYRLYTYLKNGISNYAPIDVVNAFAVWCHSGGAVNSTLVTRRIREVKLFLYNDYTGSDPHDYRYLTFDAGGGSVDNSIQFFELGKPYGSIQTPTRSGYTFGGWYAAGSLISSTTTVAKNLAVTASWTTGAPPVQTQGFPDVKSTDWFYKYVTELNAKSVVSGYSDGSFHPTDSVTGGQALKLILLAVGFPSQPAADGNWAGGYLALAQSKGIVSAGEIADLNGTITRLEVAAIAAKALGLPAAEAPETTFVDTTDGFVLALYHAGIITGTNEAGGLMFHPTSSITRAEISAIVWRINNFGAVQG